MSSDEPVKNGCEVIYEMFRILNCGLEIKLAMIFTVMNAIYAISYRKSQDFHSFESVTS